MKSSHDHSGQGAGGDTVSRLNDPERWQQARPVGLPPEGIRRVRARLSVALQTPARARRLPSWVVTAFLLLVGGVAGASVTTLFITTRARMAERAASPVTASLPVKKRVVALPDLGAPSPSPAPAVEMTASSPTGKPERIEPKALRLALSARPSPTAPPPRLEAPAEAPQAVPVEPIALEANLLRAALRALREDGAPVRALALLDEYAERFPAGALSAEATLARVDSLRRLGRDQPLRQLLEDRPITQLPRARELQVLRGELRLRAGQPREATSDFDAVLAGSARDDLAARALYGRASCRARLGDDEGARADLRLYLARFPGGERAAALRASGLESDH